MGVLPETRRSLLIGMMNLGMSILVFLFAVLFYFIKDYLPMLNEPLLFPLNITAYTFIVTSALLFSALFFLRFVVEFAKVFDRAATALATRLTKEVSAGSRVIKDWTIILTLIVFMSFTPLIKDVLFANSLFGEIAYLTALTVISTILVMFLYDSMKQLYTVIEKKIEETAKKP